MTTDIDLIEQEVYVHLLSSDAPVLVSLLLSSPLFS